MKGYLFSCLWRKGNSLTCNEAEIEIISVFYPLRHSVGVDCGSPAPGGGGLLRLPASPLPSPRPRVEGGPQSSSTNSLCGGTGKGPPSPSPRMQFIRTPPSLPWKLRAHRGWVRVPEFTQASSTISQDEFLSWSIMRPGRPESIWQPPRGRESPSRAHCC